jgi:hypothetical protein
MNRVEFKIVPDRETGNTDLVEVDIDGRPLIDRLREFEAPLAAREGAPNIAGAYAGLVARLVRLPSRHFYGDATSSYAYPPKIAVLECQCGSPGCWPMVCQVSVDDETVTWSDFEQPHRRADHPSGLWDYSTFGPFVFKRAEYEMALTRIAG